MFLCGFGRILNIRSAIFAVASSRPDLADLDMLLTQSRKRFRFQVTPSDRQLWAIGMVAVQWTNLEAHLKVIAHALYADDTAARGEFDKTLVFRHRLRMLQSR